MNKKSIILATVLFLVIIIGMFTYAYLKSNEMTQVEETSVTDEASVPDRFAYIERLDATHFNIDGTHTFVGELVMPTPCDLLQSEATVVDEVVVINFSVINNADTCIQSLTPARFMVSAEAEPEATVEAYFEGRPLQVNLLEALPGQTPDSFELFIKG